MERKFLQYCVASMLCLAVLVPMPGFAQEQKYDELAREQQPKEGQEVVVETVEKDTKESTDWPATIQFKSGIVTRVDKPPKEQVKIFRDAWEKALKANTKTFCFAEEPFNLLRDPFRIDLTGMFARPITTMEEDEARQILNAINPKMSDIGGRIHIPLYLFPDGTPGLFYFSVSSNYLDTFRICTFFVQPVVEGECRAKITYKDFR